MKKLLAKLLGKTEPPKKGAYHLDATAILAKLKAMPSRLPALEVAATSSKGRILSGTAAHLCEAARHFKGGLKPRGGFTLFTDAQERVRVLNRAAIDSGDVAAAGITVVDGDVAPTKAVTERDLG